MHACRVDCVAVVWSGRGVGMLDESMDTQSPMSRGVVLGGVRSEKSSRPVGGSLREGGGCGRSEWDDFQKEGPYDIVISSPAGMRFVSFTLRENMPRRWGVVYPFISAFSIFFEELANWAPVFPLDVS